MNFTLTPTPQNIRQDSGVIKVADIGRLETAFDLPEQIKHDVSRLLGNGAGTLTLGLVKKDIPQNGAYELDISRHGVEIAAAGLDGIRYGVRRLEQLLKEARSTFCGKWNGQMPAHDRGVLQCQQICDGPDVPLRGLHFSFPALRHLRFEEQLGLLDVMAQWNLNTLVLEYDNLFPYKNHAGLSAPDAFSMEQVRTIVRRAGELGIDVIPLHQSLGHVNFILRHEAYADISEEQEHRDQWCPLKPGSFDVFGEMADEFMEAHGAVKYFHMGGDEARRLGACPACAERAGTHGTGRVYLDFILKAADYILSCGITPIIWDDIVGQHIDVLDELPREVVLMYWDYWTVRNPSAMLVARPVGYGQVMDRRWLKEWRSELEPVERRMLECFSLPVDLETFLPQELVQRFRKYFGDEFPKRVQAFPYLQYYMDHGFKVICAGTGSGNSSHWRGLPDFPRYAENLSCFARRAVETNALGLIATLWYPMPLEAFTASIMLAGQASWMTREPAIKK